MAASTWPERSAVTRLKLTSTSVTSVASFQDAYLGASSNPPGLTAARHAGRRQLQPGHRTPLRPGRRGHRRLSQFELIQLAIEGKPGIAWYPEEHGVPPYDELIYVTSRKLANDPRLPRFLAAIEEATAFLASHPEDAQALFMKAHPDLNDELNRRRLRLPPAVLAKSRRRSTSPATTPSPGS